MRSRCAATLTLAGLRGGLQRPVARRATTLSGCTSRALSTHVSVIGLHWKTDKTRLREAFGVFGKLEQAELVTPDHSSTHLWASLVYPTFEEAFAATSEMNGQELDGRLLRVSIVDPTGNDDETVDGGKSAHNSA